MARTCKWEGVTSNAWDTATNWDTDTAPINGDSVTFYDADLGGGTKCAVGPGAGVTLVAITGDTDYGAGTICYANCTVTTVTASTGQVIAGGSITTANLNATSYMTGGTVTTANFAGSSYMTGGTVTGTLTWDSDEIGGITETAGAADLSGCTVNAENDLVIDDTATNGITTDATTVLDHTTNAGKVVYLTGVAFLGTLQATVAGGCTLNTTTIAGIINCASAVTWSITGVCSATLNETAAFNLGGAAADLPIIFNGAGKTITVGSDVECKTFTLTDGTYAAGAHKHTFNGTVLQSAGTVTATGRWIMAATGTLTITDAVAGAHFNIEAGTTTLGNALSCAAILVEAGATLSAASKNIVLAVGRVTGFGTLTNAVPTGAAIHASPGVIDGTGNSATKVVFDSWPAGEDLNL